ncbi:MAG TPA: hypothetical protein VD969_22960 [Symbiobacteriaceae bacterium]|nr:hypothetical protein [Symbiobacteriaceae bacterium]
MTDRPPDSRSWRPATGEDLWRWSWQGRGLFGRYDAPVVRIVDDLGRTVAVGLVVAYDMTAQTIALLGPGRRPDSGMWTLSATPDQIWIATLE